MAKTKPALKQITARRVQGVAVVARRIGCSPEHLSYVLHGHRKPNEKIRRGLARLGVTCTVDGKEFKEGK